MYDYIHIKDDRDDDNDVCMKVILHNDVGKLGSKNEVVDVADGYARNYLIPRHLAEIATENRIQALKEQEEKREAERREHAAQLATALEEIEQSVTIPAPVNEQGHLFAGIRRSDIASALNEALGVHVAETAIVFDDTIKETGTFEIPLRVGGETRTVNVTIEPRS